MAYAKLLIAENIKKQRKSQTMRSLYLLAVAGGIFATPEFMSNIYLSSSISDVNKVKKKIKKILKKRDVPVEDKCLLEELNQILEVNKDMKVSDLKIVISEALKILEISSL